MVNNSTDIGNESTSFLIYEVKTLSTTKILMEL